MKVAKQYLLLNILSTIISKWSMTNPNHSNAQILTVWKNLIYIQIHKIQASTNYIFLQNFWTLFSSKSRFAVPDCQENMKWRNLAATLVKKDLFMLCKISHELCSFNQFYSKIEFVFFFENACLKILEPSAFLTQILEHLLWKIEAYAK